MNKYRKRIHLVVILFAVTTFVIAQQVKGLKPIPPSDDQISGTTYAVIVGISDYQDDGIPDLQYSDNDAQAYFSYLISNAGGNVNEDNIKLLLNEEATQAQFASALDWLWEVVQENDKAIIYFSGHGDVEKKSLTQKGYLLCWDAPARVYMAGGAFPVSMMQEVISTISINNKGQVVMIADACRAGKLSGSEVGGAQITGSNLAQQFANEIKILSCQPDEYSIEGKQWGGGRGAFSYHLLEGLYGLADNDQDKTVSLKEIGRYLEDNVSEEVSPHVQTPMTIGDRKTKLSTVNEAMLADVIQSKNEGFPIFASTSQKGIEDDVLAQADSSIAKYYLEFKRKLDEKQFLEPANDCAEYYYNILIQEPQLKRLYSSMRRNYAAALQDDAQQILNTRLKSGLTEQVLKKTNPEKLYKNYPEYISRAAELLGEAHYMYNTLQARKFFFYGLLKTNKEEKLESFRNALKYQKNMPHAMVEMIHLFKAAEKDSADLYFNKSIEMVPSWVEPYVSISKYYEGALKDADAAEQFYLDALEIDSSSLLIKYQLASHYTRQGKFEKSEKLYKKLVEEDKGDICFPCLYNDFGMVYFHKRRFEEAIPLYQKAIELDSTNVVAMLSLSGAYGNLGQLDKTKELLLKIIEIDSTTQGVYNNLGNIYSSQGDFKEAERLYRKALDQNPKSIFALHSYGTLLGNLGKIDSAFVYLNRLLEIEPNNTSALNYIGIIYKNEAKYDLAKEKFRHVIKLDSTFGPALVNLGEVLINEGKIEDGIDTLNAVFNTRFAYAHPFAHYYLAAHYLKSDSLDLAQYHCEASEKIQPDFSGIRLMLAQVYIKKQMMTQAKEMIDLIISKSGDNKFTFGLQAIYEAKNNNVDQAMIYIRKSLESGFDDFDELNTSTDYAEMRAHKDWSSLIKEFNKE